jgi:hypothetical protein
MGIALGVTVGAAAIGIIAAISALGPAAPAVVASILVFFSFLSSGLKFTLPKIAGIAAAITELSQMIVNVKRMNGNVDFFLISKH